MSDWSCIIVYLNSSLVRCLNGPPSPNLRQSGSFVQTLVRWLELVVPLSYRPFDWFLCPIVLWIGSFVLSPFWLVPLSIVLLIGSYVISSFWLVLCPIVLLIGSFVYSSDRVVTNHPWRYFFWILQYSAYTYDYFFTNRVSIYTWTIMKKIKYTCKVFALDYLSLRRVRHLTYWSLTIRKFLPMCNLDWGCSYNNVMLI